MKFYQSTHVLFLVVVGAFSIPFLFNSCDSGIGGLLGVNGSFEAQQQCKTLAPGEVRKLEGRSGIKTSKIPSVFSQKKLILDSTLNPEADAFSQKLQPGLKSKLLPRGTALVALIDNQCLRQAQKTWRPGDPSTFSLELAKDQQPEAGLTVQAYHFSLEQDMESLELELELNADPCVRGAGPNKTYQLSSVFQTYNDPSVLYQSHLSAIRADESYAEFFNSKYGIVEQAGQEVKIAVIDTGVSFSHEDLQGSIWRHGANKNLWGLNAVSLGSGAVDYNPSDISPYGHGTHVSGIIAAMTNNNRGVAGIMSNAGKIMAIKVFYNDGDGNVITTTDVLVQGMLWAIEHGADVVNLSLGRLVDGQEESLDDPVYQDVIVQAINSGAVVVSATGNATEEFPAQELNDSTFNVIPARYGALYSGMINVGSVDINSNGDILGRSSFSHFGTKYVEIAAPGRIQGASGIYSTLPATGSLTKGSYGYLPGTSQSAPMVTAAAGLTIALYRSHFGHDPHPSIVEELILNSAYKDPALTTVFKDGNVLDLKGLVDSIHQRYPEIINGEASLSSQSCL